VGGVPPYRWELVGGSLPPGLRLTREGVVEGTPFEGTALSETVDMPVTVRVTDARGNTATQRI
jgi:hypothetical protein